MADGTYPTIRGILDLHDEIEAMFEDSEGEETDEVADKLATLHGDMDMKLGRLKHGDRSYGARAVALRQQARSCEALAREAEHRALTCRRAAALLLERTGHKKWELPDGEVRLGRESVQPGPGANVHLLPKELQRQPPAKTPPVEIDKKAAKAWLKAGKAVPGYRLVRGAEFR